MFTNIIVNLFCSFILIQFLYIIQMKANNHWILILLSVFKYKNLNHQIQSYLIINENEIKYLFSFIILIYQI